MAKKLSVSWAPAVDIGRGGRRFVRLPVLETTAVAEVDELAHQLGEAALLDDLRGEAAAGPSRQRFQAVLREVRAAEQLTADLRAQEEGLRQQRAAAEREAPPGLGALLRNLDHEIQTMAARAADARQTVETLQPVLGKAMAEALAVLDRHATAKAHELVRGLAARDTEIVDRLTRASAESATELCAVRMAQERLSRAGYTSGMGANVLRQLTSQSPAE